MKIAVYTAIFGEKDLLRDPLNYVQDPNIDYFLITDNKNCESDIYKIILKKIFNKDIAKNARYYKILGLAEFKGYDFLIWHDANLQLKHNTIQDLVDLVRNKQIATFQHPKRTNFYDEAIACIRDRKEEPLTLFYQCLYYFSKNYSPYCGLYETSILIKNMSVGKNSLYNNWWDEVKRFSRRDQISLPIVLDKHNSLINILNGERLNSPYAIFHEHEYKKYLSGKRTVRWPRIFKKLIIKLIEGLNILSRNINSSNKN
ncbi:glycosyltransferase domain-containing protein [Salinimicrobium xinjiangense]|uniref:glycosyltransferase domain-containing protein n=1 Tax=Salinimicrobium xinjiangense TaxID=438596 RepID=UPI0003FF1611|nr:glycosyltransferase domain-containing protein [Salinimicrobium xinjiangense]